ncbi:MAG TPA: HupE/UreJ family protein [Tepidisphaeraceae bacterium]|nr:HupE/UreJ family protein [Tepidisphaeraceae bacterium]
MSAKLTNALSIVSTFAVLALAAPVASAHPGHSSDLPWISGVLHPFTGIDHLLAMIAVGLLGAQMGRRWIWSMPATFVAFMIAGGVLAMTGLAMPLVEPGIMASVLVLGLMVARAGRLPAGAPVALVGLFAMLHGYAHVSERPLNASLLTYSIGFISSTLALITTGLAIGLAAKRLQLAQVLRLGGAAIAASGVLLMAHVL